MIVIGILDFVRGEHGCSKLTSCGQSLRFLVLVGIALVAVCCCCCCRCAGDASTSSIARSVDNRDLTKMSSIGQEIHM